MPGADQVFALSDLFDEVAVGEQGGEFTGLTTQGHGVDRQDVGSVHEISDSAKALRFTLGVEATA